MPHANAFLTPVGRLRLARLVVDDGWTYARAAERFQCSTATVKKWADRLQAGEPMTDRSSRPATSPCRTPRRLEKRIIGLRVTRRRGEHRISYHLKVPRSTVGRVLARYRMPLLAHLDQVTGQVIRNPKPVRYEREKPAAACTTGSSRTASTAARSSARPLRRRRSFVPLASGFASSRQSWPSSARRRRSWVRTSLTQKGSPGDRSPERRRGPR